MNVNWNKYTKNKKATSFPSHYFKNYANGNILDLGCGDGSHTIISSKYGNVYGIDYSEDVIEKAKLINYKAIFCDGSVYDLPYENNFFDFIYSIDVIEHLDNPDKMIFEVKRVIKDDGVFVVQTPNYPIKRFYDYYYTLSSKSGRKKFSDDSTHISKFTFFKLEKLLKQNFKDVKIEARNIFFEKRIPIIKKLKKGSLLGNLIGQKIIAICRN